jgi:AAA+ ATPase superfamily predicted ATPase
MSITGRGEEIATLEHIFHSDKPEFLALYGRRRVGKTYLIRQFFARKAVIFFNVTGSKNGSRLKQLAHFAQQIGEVFYGGLLLTVPKSWDEAFSILIKAINQQEKSKKVILFFDELPWMATKKSLLLQELDYYWNQHWSNDKRIKLIICGSSASWIINKIIKNKGGLHNRLTQKICLNPFTLLETKQFLERQGIKLKNQQILLIYMVTGGVPYYLSHIRKGMSAAQIIERLAFTEKGVLLEEFDELFASLFDNSEDYIQIIRIIASRRSGIGKRELLKTIGKAVMGSVGIKILNELEETGFIMSFMPHYHKRQGVYYRLVDEYTLFYLKWIEPIKRALQKKSLDKGNWQAMQRTPEWSNWLGYAFEAVCYKHISAIRKALSISPDAVANSWRYVPRKGTKTRGAQIDLLFDRKDDAITLCEIKNTEEPFVLTKDYVDILQRKLATFKEQTRTKKELFLVFVSANGIKNNYYAEDLISGVVTLDDLFL